MIKLIASDLDGTLLNKDMEISKENLEAIKKAQALGVKFVVATGRPYVFTKVFQQVLQLDTPYLMFNGGLVRKLSSDEVLSSSYLSKDVVLKTLTLLEETKTPYMVYQDNEVFYKPCNRVSYLMKMGEQFEEKYRAKFTLASNFHELANKYDMNKVLVVEEDKEKYEIIYKKLKEIQNDFDIVRSSSFYIEVIPKGVNKSMGLQKIAEYYNISPNEIMALGDQENDVEMISYAKYGIAMENAIDKVKEVAYDVTLKNTENGVAHAINKYVISKLENN